ERTSIGSIRPSGLLWKSEACCRKSAIHSSQGKCAALLYHDFASFAARAFRELNPRTPFAVNWHVELIAAKLAAVRAGRIKRLIVSLPPRHLKSHLASVAFPP